MSELTASESAQIYAEISHATSPATAEVIVQRIVNAPWDDLLTKDHRAARMSSIDIRFAQVDGRFAQVDARFDQVDARFDQVDARFDRVDARFAVIDSRFAALTAQMDARFAESDAKHERSLRNVAVGMMAALFTFNGALAAWLTALN